MVDHFHGQVLALGRIGGEGRSMVVTSGIELPHRARQGPGPRDGRRSQGRHGAAQAVHGQ